MRNIVFWIAAAAAALTATLALGAPRLDDSDLTGSDTRSSLHDLSRPLSNELAIDRIDRRAIGQGLEIELVRNADDLPVPMMQPIAGMELRATAGSAFVGTATTNLRGLARVDNCPIGQSYTLTARFTHRLFKVAGSNGEYLFRTEAKCGEHIRLQFDGTTAGGQATGIWRIAELAVRKLQESVGLDFWTSALVFNWPADGDYFSFGRVSITRGEKWDVVGHELGHAVYHLANIGVMGGGQHKIDECYTDALALSEGWASFFSAWLSIAANDGDARFQYMVPRRAPIRIETIPEDVCKGPRSEWRATGFFWDLYDANDDGETTNATFARMWTALKNMRVRSMTDAASLFERRGFPTDEINRAWELNFLTERR